MTEDDDDPDNYHAIQRRDNLALAEHGIKAMGDARCGEIAASLRASVKRYRFELHPTSTLARMIGLADGASKRGLLAAQTEEQVHLLGYAERISMCLDWFAGVEDKTDTLKWLTTSLDRINDPHAKGLDRLYEIDVAASLAKSRTFSVSLGEPDVIATTSVPATKTGFACKDPDTHKGVIRCVTEAARQIEDSGFHGIAMVSVDGVQQRKGKWCKVKDHAHAQREAVAQVEAVVNAAVPELAKQFAKRQMLLGAIFTISLPYLAESPALYTAVQRAAAWRHNHRLNGAKDRVQLFVLQMYPEPA